VLRVEPQVAVYDTAEQGEVPLVDATAVWDEETGGVTLFAVNRHQTEPLALDVDVRSLPALATAEHTCVADDDPDAINDMADPDRVRPWRLDDPKLDAGRLEAVLPPLSWSMIRVS
jgi:alpha-N-arabinofuranosidase